MPTTPPKTLAEFWQQVPLGPGGSGAPEDCYYTGAMALLSLLADVVRFQDLPPTAQVLLKAVHQEIGGYFNRRSAGTSTGGLVTNIDQPTLERWRALLVESEMVPCTVFGCPWGRYQYDDVEKPNLCGHHGRLAYALKEMDTLLKGSAL